MPGMGMSSNPFFATGAPGAAGFPGVQGVPGMMQVSGTALSVLVRVAWACTVVVACFDWPQEHGPTSAPAQQDLMLDFASLATPSQARPAANQVCDVLLHVLCDSFSKKQNKKQQQNSAVFNCFCLRLYLNQAKLDSPIFPSLLLHYVTTLKITAKTSVIDLLLLWMYFYSVPILACFMFIFIKIFVR